MWLATRSGFAVPLKRGGTARAPQGAGRKIEVPRWNVKGEVIRDRGRHLTSLRKRQAANVDRDVEPATTEHTKCDTAP
jgi:hypothetical protein